MRAVLKAYGDCSRKVWLADSFRGLPQPDSGQYSVDHGDTLWTYTELAISLEEVKANFSVMGCWMSRWNFCRAGFATRYRLRRLIDWRS